MLEAPTTPAKVDVAAGQFVFRQPVRVLAAVRIDQDVAVPVTENGKVQTLLPSGTVLVSAVGERGAMYCAAAPSPKRIRIGIGVCLQDVDGDDAFDQILVAGSTDPVSTPFQIVIGSKARWRPVQTAYSKLASDTVPKGEIAIRYVRHDAWRGHPEAYLGFMNVCWPNAMIVHGGAADDACGQLLAGRDIKASDQSDRYLDLAVSGPQTLTWGPYRLSITQRAQGRADVEVLDFLRPGPAAIELKKFWLTGLKSNARVDVYGLDEIGPPPGQTAAAK